MGEAARPGTPAKDGTKTEWKIEERVEDGSFSPELLLWTLDDILTVKVSGKEILTKTTVSNWKA